LSAKTPFKGSENAAPAGGSGRFRAVARVILDLQRRGLWQVYDYEVPAGLSGVKPGATVVVPVRSGHNLGYVIEVEEAFPSSGVKPILAVVDGARLIGPKQIELSRWLSDHYLTGLSDALKLNLPTGLRPRLTAVLELEAGVETGEPPLVWLAQNGGRATEKDFETVFGKPATAKLLQSGLVKRGFRLEGPAIKPKTSEFAALVSEQPPSARLGPKQLAILEDLRLKSPIPVKLLLDRHQTARETLNRLVNKQLVRLFERQEERETDTSFTNLPGKGVALNLDQEQALAAIAGAIEAGQKRLILLDGVTGSGKTEVYIRAIDLCLRQGRSAIVLVPEIALLPQLAERLSHQFGPRLAVIHSGLGAGQRIDAWQAVASGHKKLVVGARSALFAPVENLGLVVIDEEHETSYKQNAEPRYDARVVAAKLADLHGATVVLGSATPSLETRVRVETDGLHLKLPERAAGLNFPKVKIIDMRQEFKHGNYGLFSDELARALAEALDNGHKAILLINRRGFANFLLCRQCGFVPECVNCSVSLTFHQRDGSLVCHHCGDRLPAPPACPKCGTADWRFAGAGTQRVETELKEALGDVTFVRMDADTTTRRDAHRRQLLEFYHAKRAVLIGTQMVAKGLDFPSVAVVGIINADTALNLPDFRAAERTAQLLIQAGGRSGRGPIPGRVFIQTYNPDNYAVKAAIGGYEDFCLIETGQRRELGYPPFSSMVNVIFSSLDERRAAKRAQEFADKFTPLLEGGVGLLLGPAPAPIHKIKGHWRWHAAITTTDPKRVKCLLRENNRLIENRKDVRVIVDVDPVWML
jgi:primosomal protein N' (replication factor Y) (superfamily II helicase)